MSHSVATYEDGKRERFGGGVSYGGKTAATLGIPATVVTIGAEDIEPGVQELKSAGIEVWRVQRNSSNNFSNDYRGGHRKLNVSSYIKEPFSKSDFKETLVCDFVVFFPGLHEITPELLDVFQDKIIFLDAGGLTRELGEKNGEGLYPIIQGYWKSIDGFRGKVNILKVSYEDLENIKFESGIATDGEKAQSLAENGFPMVLFTRGKKSTILARKGMPPLEIPVFLIEGGGDEAAASSLSALFMIDEAGAGEVFSVGFIYEYFLTKDPVKAVSFGNACSSYKIAKEDYNYEKAKKRAAEIS
jgi:hypothetical protein